jgi:hypothetical protein
MPRSSLVKFGVTDGFPGLPRRPRPVRRLWDKPLHINGFNPVQGVEDPGIQHEPLLFL